MQTGGTPSGVPPIPDCRKSPSGLSDNLFAVCCAHFVGNKETIFRFLQAKNSICFFLSPLPIKAVAFMGAPLANGRQIPHLQPERYFCPGTRPGQKWIQTLFAPCGANSARLFRHAEMGGTPSGVPPIRCICQYSPRTVTGYSTSRRPPPGGRFPGCIRRWKGTAAFDHIPG